MASYSGAPQQGGQWQGQPGQYQAGQPSGQQYQPGQYQAAQHGGQWQGQPGGAYQYQAGQPGGQQYQPGQYAAGCQLQAGQYAPGQYQAGVQYAPGQYAAAGQYAPGQYQAGQQQNQYLGAGYGHRREAPADIQAQYYGKPAFYDANRGVLYDGKTAWYYAPSSYGAGSAPYGQQQYASGTPYGQQSNVVTAIEKTPYGTRITIGNGTQGNLREHAAGYASQYALEGTAYSL